MTVVKYFDAPHIVRFGMTSHDSGWSEMQVWRNGVHFQIKLDQDNIRGTDFELQWIPLLNPEPIQSYGDRWNQHCDLVISHCMKILQGLAPNTPYWTNIHDYFYNPSYIIGLYGITGSNVIPRIIESPINIHAYEM
ncbi:hypothetical protein V1509DRAFT_609698 [Lipomyces kononenkoae]